MRLVTDWEERVRALTDTPLARLAGEIAAMADEARTAFQEGKLTGTALAGLEDALVSIITSGEGNPRARLACGELLGHLGDPRLKVPADAEYWIRLTLKSGDTFRIGRFPVTNHEYRAWVDGGGYTDRVSWSDKGWEWLQETDDAWPTLAARPDVAAFVVANQPVIGVSWFEADAYARAHGARLPRWDERVFAVRGAEKRPYPWGSPFGEGNANTKEEVLERPCAVGLYVKDCTPDGIHDLAGNAAEWTAEEAGVQYLLHPGSWDQPSLASWAKALTSASPSSRWSALGFRLAAD